jgi:DNA-binding FrmR family transcriptional regulator
MSGAWPAWSKTTVTALTCSLRSASSPALQEVALGLLDDHVRHCLLDAARSGPLAADGKLSELSGAFRRTLRL